jgi:uncharacterized membrane protein
MNSAPESPRRILFRASLSPHRSLSRPAFRRVMIAVTLFSFTVSTVTFLAGAWPVFGFMGLDVLLVYLALRASYRRARRSEVLELDDEALTVERTDIRGERRCWTLQPAWLRVDLAEPVDSGTPLLLRSHGRSLAVGALVGPDERRNVARDLRDALDWWRRPGARRSSQPFSPRTSRIE